MEVPAILLVAAVVGGLASSGQAINYDEIVAKGYRWVTVDGPYACVSKDDLRQILKKRGTEAELQAIKQQRAYYLLQGDIVKVTREDPTSGMSLIRIAGVPKDLWTAAKLLSKRPIENAFGVIETPETSGLILAEITRLKDQ
jgi:DNA-directed RNA polymerase subunit H (RpoH/RPB5)